MTHGWFAMMGSATPSRREALALGGSTALAAASPIPAATSIGSKAQFGDIGTYLNAAAMHPTPKSSAAAALAMLDYQVNRAGRPRPPVSARNAIANLINAMPAKISFVPSTGHAENLLADALGLGPGRGVLTDALHFHGALAMYGQRARQDMPLVVVQPRDGRIRLEDVAAGMTKETRLIALAEISNFNGFRHDLRAICDMAHAQDVLVYADIIQAVGAIPIDVRSTGVDFCAASTYKWMMGVLGFAFLYARRDRQDRLRHATVGWAELADVAVSGQDVRYDAPVSKTEWQFAEGAAGFFEVG